MLTLSVIALSLAVVLYGGSYKMQQYPEQGLAFRVMPPAKLLTENERPIRARSRRVVEISPVHRLKSAAMPPAWTTADPQVRILGYVAGPVAPVPEFPDVDSPQFVFFSFRPPPPSFPS